MVTYAEDNPFPSVLFTEHVDPANPSAGQQRLFVDTDHVLKMVNSSGTITTFTGGAGLTDPMTTRGDVIIRDASNVTARLGIGSSGKVLTSNGTDISWQTPSAGSLSSSMTQLSGNVTMTTAGTWYDGPVTAALATGTWLLVASIAMSSASNGTQTAQIRDSSGTTYASAVGFCVAGGNNTLAMTAIVTGNGTLTFKASATSQINGNLILAAAGFNGVGNNVSTIVAVKIA